MQTDLNKAQALTQAIEFITSFTRSDFETRAEYARYCDYRKKYNDSGIMPSIKTIEKVMLKKGYEIIFKKSKEKLAQ